MDVIVFFMYFLRDSFDFSWTVATTDVDKVGWKALIEYEIMRFYGYPFSFVTK